MNGPTLAMGNIQSKTEPKISKSSMLKGKKSKSSKPEDVGLRDPLNDEILCYIKNPMVNGKALRWFQEAQVTFNCIS